MHAEAFRFVSRFKTNEPISVIECGSRDINGTVRPLFPCASWIGLDWHAGPCVDVVCDAVDYFPSQGVDLVVCTEVLEHAPNWRELIQCASSWLLPGGRFLMTCAGPGRAPHSHHDGCGLHENEYYGNLSADQIAEECHNAGMSIVCAEEGLTVPDDQSCGTDTRVCAMKALGPS